MKKFLFAIASLLMIVSCANSRDKSEGNASEDVRELSGFECIVMTGSMDVKYQQSDEFSVIVKTRKSNAENVITRVEGNALVVSMKGTNKLVNFGWPEGDDVTVYVTSPDLIGVSLSGSGDFKSKKPVDTDSLDIVLKGSGDVDFADIICDQLNASVVGSGDIKVLKLKTQMTNVSVIGSGEMKINQQDVRQTNIELKGSGDVKVNCLHCDQVDTRLMGSGEIELSGDVNTHNSYKLGSGSLDTEKLTVNK